MTKDRLSALDTETIGGYAVILSTEYNTWVADSFESCIETIFRDIGNHKIGSRLMMWNQGYDSQAILKYLPDENLNEIIDTGETLYNDRYKIKYIKGKFLQIRDLRFKISISGYDIAQFFNYMHLDDAGVKYVNDRKIHNNITHEITERAQYHTDNELYWFFAHHLQQIKDYCKQDAALTLKLAYFLADTIEEMYGFRLKRYTAKTLIGKELIKRTVGKAVYKSGKSVVAYPKFMEETAPAKMAIDSYHGGIFDCIQRGTFDTVTDIDISSAYPYHMRKLPNWSNGNFIAVWEEDIKSEDEYGWILCEFNYPLIPYHSMELSKWEEIHSGEPRIVKAVNKRKYYPAGKRWAIITLVEWRFLKKYGYLLNTGDGYVWRHDPEKIQYPDPFSWIDNVYRQKQQIKAVLGKKVFKYSLTKIPMNSAYGITAQKKGSAAFRNMFYASSITANTRMQICEMLEEIGYDTYISIATDGILIDGLVELPERYTQGGLGSWDVEVWDSALVIANGIYQLERPGKTKMALRGMLSYKGNLKEGIEKHKHESKFVPNTKSRPVTMYHAMNWHKYTRDSMNRFMPIGRTLSCNAETSKHWDVIETFEPLLSQKYKGKRFTVDEVAVMK